MGMINHHIHDCIGPVETVVFGYYKMDKRNRIMDSLDVYMDPIVRYSTGIWVDVPSKALARLEELQLDRMASIHGAGKGQKSSPSNIFIEA